MNRLHKPGWCFFFSICVFFFAFSVGIADEQKSEAKKKPDDDFGYVIRKATAKKMARDVLHKLIISGSLDKSWNDAKITETLKKVFAKEEEWRVAFHNPVIEKKEEQTYYIFLSRFGEMMGANYTGQ
ncbi:MAG: DUF6488 family protein [Gammaproteobacteria bacterium]|nr:DUF6488 family protein [Gammaproteobacteria bacterium]MDH5731491.1 DUF6488 family protein [Gammaproteobacteria bacterium]